MADVRYTVVADFKLDAKKSAAGMAKVANNAKRAEKSLMMSVFQGNLLANAVSRAARGMGDMAMFGARAFGSWIKLGLDFNNTMAKTKVGLGAIISTATGATFAEGFQEADKYSKLLVTDAAKSVATTRQLFDVFAETAGPILGMGKGLDEVRKITNGTIAAAAALNVDFAQSRRDIGMMLTGAAGVDVKLFRMLRSSRAITQSTREWNEMLPVKRLEALKAALGKFQVASEAYAMTWSGVSSTFEDLFEIFAGAGTESLTEQVKFVVADINSMLAMEYDTIIGWFRATFQFMGEIVRTSYDQIKAWTMQNWDAIIAVWDEGVSYGRRILLPMLTDMNFMFTMLGGAFKFIGMILSPLIGIIRLFIVVMRILQDNWKHVTADLAKLDKVWMFYMNRAAGRLNTFFNFFIDMINAITAGLGLGKGNMKHTKITGEDVSSGLMVAGAAAALVAAPVLMGGVLAGSLAAELEDIFPTIPKAPGAVDEEGKTAAGGARGRRKTPPPVIDMKGAKITVKQDFRDADPDRIMLQMMNDIGRAAESRTQSGFAPAFSR